MTGVRVRFGRDKTSGAGHIKKNTQGTSNEISFSVLDSMKGQENEGDDRSPLGRISLFTLGPKKPSSTPSKDPSLPEKFTRSAHSAPSKPAWQLDDPEVKARRAQRRRGRWLVFGIVAIVCVIALTFAAIIGYGRYQQMQLRAQDLSAQVEDVREQYQVAEPFLQLVETTLKTPLPDIDAAALEQQLSDWEGRQQNIVTKMRVTKTALAGLQEQLGGRDLDRANDAEAAINATINAMDAARDVLTEVASMARLYDQGEAFLAHAMAGDSAAREAVANELVDDAVAEAAIQSSNNAIAEFGAARDAVSTVISQGSWLIEQSGVYSQSAADLLQPFQEYANLRIQAQEFAIQTDEGYLALSSQQMREANANYNATEAQAAELIAQYRDAYPTDIVQQAYDATIPVEEQVTAWQTEWAKAKQSLEQA